MYLASSNLPTRTLGSAESRSRRSFGVQIIHDRFFSDFLWFLDFKLLLQRQAGLLGSDFQYSSFHQRVQHAVLDRFIAGCQRAGIKEENWRLLCAIVSVGESEKSESRLCGGNGAG